MLPSSPRSEAGSASLELITAGVILLVPLVYLVLTVASIQAGALAVESAAREAARVFVQAKTPQEGRRAAERAVDFVLADHGVEAGSMTVDCEVRGCLVRHGLVTVTVEIAVPLPLLPEALTAQVPLEVGLGASATQQVSRFAP